MDVNIHFLVKTDYRFLKTCFIPVIGFSELQKKYVMKSKLLYVFMCHNAHTRDAESAPYWNNLEQDNALHYSQCVYPGIVSSTKLTELCVLAIYMLYDHDTVKLSGNSYSGQSSKIWILNVTFMSVELIAGISQLSVELISIRNSI